MNTNVNRKGKNTKENITLVLAAASVAPPPPPVHGHLRPGLRIVRGNTTSTNPRTTLEAITGVTTATSRKVSLASACAIKFADAVAIEAAVRLQTNSTAAVPLQVNNIVAVPQLSSSKAAVPHQLNSNKFPVNLVDSIQTDSHHHRHNHSQGKMLLILVKELVKVHLKLARILDLAPKQLDRTLHKQAKTQ